MENEPEETKDTMHPTNNGSTEDVQPSVVQSESLILTSELVNSPTIEPVASPVSVPRPNQRPSIPYPSRMHDQKLRDKANDQRDKSGRESLFHTDNGIRLMLALRSSRAKHSAFPRKSHGIKNLPGSPSFSGNFFRRTAEQCSFNGVLASS
nr:hypothetical protein [Tanacetum cinerariifolium]